MEHKNVFLIKLKRFLMCFPTGEKWKQNGSAEQLWHAAYKRHALVAVDGRRLPPPVSLERNYTPVRARGKRKSEGLGGGKKKRRKKMYRKQWSDLWGWLKPTQRQNVFLSYLTWKHAWGCNAWCNAPELWVLLKTWQLSEDPHTILPFLCMHDRPFLNQ